MRITRTTTGTKGLLRQAAGRACCALASMIGVRVRDHIKKTRLQASAVAAKAGEG